MENTNQNKKMVEKLKSRLGELIFKITELESIIEVQADEIKNKDDIIKKLQSSIK